MTLSKEARAALVNTTARVGAPVREVTPVIVLGELHTAGLVTEAGNLTFRGVTTRRVVLDEMLRTLEGGHE